MTVHPNSLKALEENRKKGQFVSGERAVSCGKKGKIESDKVKAENKSAQELVTMILNAPVLDDKAKAQLEAYGLPSTMFVKTLFNAVQKAGVNSNMLRVLLELIGVLKQQQTNVTVNNHNPYANFTEEELRKIANDTDENE